MPCRKFWDKTRLESVDSQNFLQVRNCIPQNKLPALKNIYAQIPANKSVLR